MSYYQALAGVQELKISEHVSLIEAASAMLGQEIEMANKYSVSDKKSGQKLFYAVEQTNCCNMQMKQCLGDCAAWSVDILWTGDGGAQPALKMDRPCTVTCCCFNRPTVTITDANTQEELGHITDPCNCIGMDLAARNADGDKLFSANGGCCQIGVFCPMPCGPCSKIEYDLQDQDGNSAGKLTKKVPGCLKFFFAPDVDNYIVEFNEDADVWQNPQNKAMMIAMALFMDFRYFSDNPNDEDGGAGDQFQNLLGGE